MSRLEIESVSKRYGDLWALRDVSLEIDRGVVGLLGPNGAGKSTLMRILATISRPTEGRVLWEGRPLTDDPDRLRRTLGYLPQEFGLYPRLTAREFLRYLASAKGLDADERLEQLLSVVNLREAADRKLETYSGGMRQRVGIAQALLNDPDLLIVDEPTVGLDPEERARFRSLLSELGGDRIVLLSTHIVSDVEATAQRIAVLDDGHLRADGPPEELLAAVEGRVWEAVVAADRLPDLRSRYPVASAAHRADGAHVRLVADGPPTENARQVDPSLEDAYLGLMQDGREDGGEGR
ncbi:MAG: ABC transporter ATP-binding protein [Candidatus Palauibacterales bacterium]|nr:ABC transporter ATP-binding protein [Candidatus Palauibacterales bacterium]